MKRDGKFDDFDEDRNRNADRISFWAQLLELDDGHGKVVRSPAFANQAEMAGWCRHERNRREEGSFELFTYRRETTGPSSFRDVRLSVSDQIPRGNVDDLKGALVGDEF